jgi:hypothetical protein
MESDAGKVMHIKHLGRTMIELWPGHTKQKQESGNDQYPPAVCSLVEMRHILCLGQVDFTISGISYGASPLTSMFYRHRLTRGDAVCRLS